jgi:methylthioribose-1-phosphate isomerase
VAPRSTFDLKITTGRQIPIEERAAGEVTALAGRAIAPRGVKAYNPAFDITPHKLITGIVTEAGILRWPFKKIKFRKTKGATK